MLAAKYFELIRLVEIVENFLILKRKKEEKLMRCEIFFKHNKNLCKEMMTQKKLVNKFTKPQGKINFSISI